LPTWSTILEDKWEKWVTLFISLQCLADRRQGKVRSVDPSDNNLFIFSKL
jgi:hypothetical protein